MKPAILALAAVMLSGCVGTSVGTIALCVGICRYNIEPQPVQSASEKLGADLGGLAADWLLRPRK